MVERGQIQRTRNQKLNCDYDQKKVKFNSEQLGSFYSFKLKSMLSPSLIPFQRSDLLKAEAPSRKWTRQTCDCHEV